MNRWLKSLFSGTSPTPRSRPSFRPGLECLEDRVTPSTTDAGVFVRRPVRPEALRRQRPILWNVAPLSINTVQLRFTRKLGKEAYKLTSYEIPGLSVLGVQVSRDRKTVTLTTNNQAPGEYLIRFNHLKTKDGTRVDGPLNSLPWNSVAVQPSAPNSDATPPRVVGAASTSNSSVLVSFSEPMSDSALNPLHYTIAQDTINPEAGVLRVLGVDFQGTRSSVVLTTDSQNELAYTVTVVNVTDLAGNTLAPAVLAGGARVDPTRASFHGTPPSVWDLTDTDEDGLTDNEEQRGWVVSFKLLDGTITSRGVTSDPLEPDSDGDGLPDAQEATLRLDPRDSDTDDDQLNDNQEFNEVYSDPTKQDSDADGLDDGLEFNFFRTSPTLADTDGDQLPDGQEVLLGNRNPRLADVPSPALEVGGVALRLDVRFVETVGTAKRELETRSVESTLTQSERQEHSNSNSVTIGSEATLSVGTEWEVEAGSPFKAGGKWQNSINAETSTSHSWTGKWSENSSTETQQAYKESLETQNETTRSSSVERQVVGARMQVTVALKNTSNLAYRVKNLQVTAFIQDPQNPTNLTPVATLLPDSEPDDGYTLGPLVPERGPFIFSNDTIFPNLVDSLMKNPRGLVFQFSNYDITDEFGRNFAFTSKDIIDRTGSLVLDFGGYDSDLDGEGDLSEYYRVATGAGRVIDTNGDGSITEDDHRVVFDANGKHVGITLREALFAIGLTHCAEADNPTATLTPDEIQNSYSTVIDAAGVERIFRIRKTAAQEGIRKTWEIITATGIDQTIGLDDFIITTAEDVKLAFVQDLDGDRLPATLEFLLGTSDSPEDKDKVPGPDGRDTDKDGLDDRFETLIGWQVDVVGRGSRPVFSSGTLADSDRDGIIDRDEALGELVFDPEHPGLIEEARPHITDEDGDGIPDPGPAGTDGKLYPAWHQVQTDPFNPDTDGDSISDFDEINRYSVTLRRTGGIIRVSTDPTNPDTDRDTAPDGVEQRLGGNPTDSGDSDDFSDDDRDGLVNVEEREGWDVIRNKAPVRVKSDPENPDTDGDGLSDGEELRLKTIPADVHDLKGDVLFRGQDSDGDGLTDFQEVRGFELRDLGVIVLNPNDADTDNDKLSDGVEAELVDIEGKRWVVRVHGADPYRVYSDPRFADADFDGLGDGDERAQGSDPTKANTDGDRRNDYREFQVGTNPLEEDVRVTVVFTAWEVHEDGDSDDQGFNPGDMGFYFGVRLPDPASPTGLSGLHDVLVERIRLTDSYRSEHTTVSEVEPYLPWAADPNDEDAAMKRNNGYGIAIAGQQTLFVAGLVPFAERSISFNLTKNGHFTIEGVLHDFDDADANGDNVRGNWVYFGGMDHAVAAKVEDDTEVRVFEGEKVFAQAFQSVTFEYTTDDATGQNSTNAPFNGKVRALYLVS